MSFSILVKEIGFLDLGKGTDLCRDIGCLSLGKGIGLDTLDVGMGTGNLWAQVIFAIYISSLIVRFNIFIYTNKFFFSFKVIKFKICVCFYNHKNGDKDKGFSVYCLFLIKNIATF